jgi:hypothetical protein
MGKNANFGNVVYDPEIDSNPRAADESVNQGRRGGGDNGETKTAISHWRQTKTAK